MLEVVLSNRFKKDLKLAARRGLPLDELNTVVDWLAAGLTQLELAEKLGVTIGTIGYYERGAGMPKTDNLFALCDILHIRPADLLRADS